MRVSQNLMLVRPVVEVTGVRSKVGLAGPRVGAPTEPKIFAARGSGLQGFARNFLAQLLRVDHRGAGVLRVWSDCSCLSTRVLEMANGKTSQELSSSPGKVHVCRKMSGFDTIHEDSPSRRR